MAFLIGNDGVVIEGNELYDIAASGIEIGDDYYKARDFRMYPKSICIQNNYIHDIAQDYRGGCGITVMYADGVEILHNYIKEVPYSGMSVGWGWDNQPPEQHRNFTVSYNIIENAMQELYDGGLFYSPDPVNGNNIIEGNFLIGNERTMSPGSQQNGVYFDASSSGWHAKDNVIMNVPQNYAVSKDANTTIENLYTNNSSAALWEGGGEDILVVTGLVSDKKADWSTDYEARVFEIMKNAGLEEEYLYLAQRDKFKMYAPTPTYYIEDSGAENPLTVSVIIENKTNSQYSATISMEMNTETSISKQVVLAPGDNRVDFEVTIQAGQGLKIYPGRVKLTAENTLMSIPVYISIDPPEEFTVTIYDEGYEEVRGNWSVSGLPNTRIGSANSKGYAIARYTPSKLTSGTYKVWFYGVPNSANGLNPHDFIIYDRYGQKHVTKIYQRTIPAGWNHIGTYELDGKSYVELHQVGGGSMRTSPVAFCPLN